MPLSFAKKVEFKIPHPKGITLTQRVCVCVELVIADGRFNESTGFMNIRKFSISVERRKACFVLEGTILECRKFRFRLTFFVLSEIFVRGPKVYIYMGSVIFALTPSKTGDN